MGLRNSKKKKTPAQREAAAKAAVDKADKKYAKNSQPSENQEPDSPLMIISAKSNDSPLTGGEKRKWLKR